MLQKECLWCKNEFKVLPYRYASAKCCSRKCLWHITKTDREIARLKKIVGKKAHNNVGIEMKCEYCNKIFSISPSRLGKKKYCTKKCYALADSTRIPSRTGYRHIIVDGEMKKLHRHLMEESIGRLLRKDEHVHHLDGNIHNNDLKNLQVLSISEHGKISGIISGERRKAKILLEE